VCRQPLAGITTPGIIARARPSPSPIPFQEAARAATGLHTEIAQAGGTVSEPQAVSERITYADFERVEVRVGRIVATEEFPKARRPAYKLWIDFGPYGTRKSSAQLAALYSREGLVGRQVIAVLNFPPRQIADFMSEVLVLGVPDADGAVVLLQPDRDVPLGGRLF
jgi:tRNA-binding protein